MNYLKTCQQKIASCLIENNPELLGSPANLRTNTRSDCKSFVCLIIAHKLCSCAASQILSDGHLNLGSHEQRYMVISMGFPWKWCPMVRFADLWPSKKSSHLGREMWNLKNALVNKNIVYIYMWFFETTLYKSISFAKTWSFWWSPRKVCYLYHKNPIIQSSPKGLEACKFSP